MTGMIQRAWSRRTSADPDNWTAGNPARGQCAVTALVVQDLFGGSLMRCLVPDAYTTGTSVSHYWNRLPNGAELDLTFHQFGAGARCETPKERDRDYVLSFPDTNYRYYLLRHRLGWGPAPKRVEVWAL